MKQLVVASEYGEPSNHQEVICQRLFNKKSTEKKDVCLLLITKNLPNCLKILGTADALHIPTQIHCTITGLGGTKLEPQVPTPNLMVEESIKMIEKYRINPEAVTIRIDPIVPEYLNLQMVEIPHILGPLASIGVKDCRISIVDYYPHVRERFDKLGIEHPNKFQEDKPTKDSIISKLACLTVQLDMRLHLCAESLPKKPEINIDTEGCASSESWKRLGIDSLRPITRGQRKECTCDLKKEDLLAGLEKGCKPGCAYCYWR